MALAPQEVFYIGVHINHLLNTMPSNSSETTWHHGAMHRGFDWRKNGPVPVFGAPLQWPQCHSEIHVWLWIPLNRGASDSRVCAGYELNLESILVLALATMVFCDKHVTDRLLIQMCMFNRQLSQLPIPD